MINIDCDISELIRQIWEKGIETSACCQGEESENYLYWAYISFDKHENIIKFIQEYPVTEHVGIFDILNCGVELTKLSANYIVNYVPKEEDLYTFRFNKRFIFLLLE
jgi:hypothetical protein